MTEADELPAKVQSARPKVVVVGAGFGGLSAAKRLAHAPVDVTIIDRRNHHLFQPLLYQVATAALSPADIAVPIRSVLSAGDNPSLTVLLDEVTGVDTKAKRIRTRDGADQSFDYLIIATGSVYNYFGRENDWEAVAPALKTLEDAIEVRRRVLMAFERAESSKDPAEQEKLLTFVVIGGGPTGVEMVGALAELARASLARDFTRIDPRRARIILIEAGDELLGTFTDQQSEYTKHALERMGAEVRLNARVEQITKDGVTAAGEFIPAANVLWCAGVKATPAADWLDAEKARNGATIVNSDLSLPGHPEIFVIGDASSLSSPDGKPYPALAPVAKQQGQHVAEVIARRVSGRDPPGPFTYRDWGTMATIGRAAAVGKFGRLHIQGFIAWLFWGAVHITYLVGFRNRLVVVVNWIWAWITYGKGARLITGSATLPPDGIRAVAQADLRNETETKA